jgi:hypothetical protein
MIRTGSYVGHLFQPPFSPTLPTGTLCHDSPRTCFFRAIARGKFLKRKKGTRQTPSTHIPPRTCVKTRLIKKAMLTTHVAPISLVLGGPISRRTAGLRVLRHLETVRHDFFTHTPKSHTHTHTRAAHAWSPPFLSLFPLFEGGLDADAKKNDAITFL